MLNVKKFDDINYLEINNIEGEKILNRFYNITNIIKDKYGLSREVIAVVQFKDYSFGIIVNDYNKKFTVIYGIKYDDCLIESNSVTLLSFDLINNGMINSTEIVQYNLSCCVDNRCIKRIFTLNGYSEF